MHEACARVSSGGDFRVASTMFAQRFGGMRCDSESRAHIQCCVGTTRREWHGTVASAVACGMSQATARAGFSAVVARASLRVAARSASASSVRLSITRARSRYTRRPRRRSTLRLCSRLSVRVGIVFGANDAGARAGRSRLEPCSDFLLCSPPARRLSRRETRPSANVALTCLLTPCHVLSRLPAIIPRCPL